jgi:hypothetical protein
MMLDTASMTSAAFVATQVNGTINTRGFGVVAPGFSNPDQGYGCLLYYGVNSLQPEVGIIDVSNFSVVNEMGYAWQVDQPYVLFKLHNGSAHGGMKLQPSPPTLVITGNATSPAGATRAVIGTTSVSLRVHWVMHVESP